MSNNKLLSLDQGFICARFLYRMAIQLLLVDRCSFLFRDQWQTYHIAGRQIIWEQRTLTE